MQPVRRRLAQGSARALAALALGLAAACCIGATVQARPAAHASTSAAKPLSAKDERAYAAAFAAVHDGRFDDAQALAKHISNPVLKGRLAYARLMHPAYTASYDELVDWLDRYHDQPDADRVYTLARKKKPAAAPAPTAPDAAAGSDAAIWARVETLAERVEAASPAPDTAPDPELAPAPPPREATAPTRKVDAALQAAREAYYDGDVTKAYKLAVKAGEGWIAGLAGFRLKHYEEAEGRFAALAQDATVDEWVRSGAAYWAARAAIAAGSPEAAPQYLKLAARTPYTFYGLIAERELGLDPGVTVDGLDPGLAPFEPATPAAHSARTAPPGRANLAHLIKTDARARRAAAFAQLGMKAEAGSELRAGLAGAAGADRRSWMQLGLALDAALTTPADLTRSPHARFDIAQYPTPDLAPDGGFTLDRALVYALVRQESRFDASASSAAGAYGLMQLTPATAARMAGDDKLRADPSPLKDPAVNLRLGQDYVARLLTAVNGDLLHAVAAYNSGPGVIQKTLAKLGQDSDSLLAIESMPGAQTRDYVEKVVANYWIYRNILGQDSPTLDAAASARRKISAALDQPAVMATAKLAPAVLASFFQPETGPR